MCRTTPMKTLALAASAAIVCAATGSLSVLAQGHAPKHGQSPSHASPQHGAPSALAAPQPGGAHSPSGAPQGGNPVGQHGQSAAHQSGHGGHSGRGGHGGHGEVVIGTEAFPTTGYADKRQPRAPQAKSRPHGHGSPELGKQIAHGDKGRCLTCHVLDSDGALPGDVGPNLSTYGSGKRDPAATYQQIWDARVLNPSSMMPPFGTNGLLDETEVSHVVAYLLTLNRPVIEPARPVARTPRARVFVAGEDLSRADDHLDGGAAAFREPGVNGKSCKSCHAAGDGQSMLERASTRYPRFDSHQGKVIGLEERINACRQEWTASPSLPLDSLLLNQLSSYVKSLGRGKFIAIDDEGGAAAFERGRQSFERKAGQLNFSCADCHSESGGGKWLRGQRMQKLDTIPGQWPKHYIALHDLDLINLRQRIQHCQIVMRTFPLALESQEYLELEYFLTRSAAGTLLLAPTMSRLRGE